MAFFSLINSFEKGDSQYMKSFGQIPIQWGGWYVIQQNSHSSICGWCISSNQPFSRSEVHGPSQDGISRGKPFLR